MENNKDNINNEKVKIERHKWPDEIKEEKRAARSRSLTTLIVAFAFFVVGFMSSKTLFRNTTIAGNDKYNLIQEIMTSEWYFGKDIEDLNTIIKDKGYYGMATVDEVDPHTTYLSADEMTQYTSNLSGAYVGIGVQYYEAESGSFIVQRVFEDSPAQKAGLEAGDILIAVSGISVEGEDINEVSRLVMGDEGTDVTVTIIRDNKEMDVTMTRAQVMHSAYGEELENNVGYIQLDQFGETTATEVLRYLEKFEGKDSKLIIDVRDNGGGYLSSVVDIASYFIEKDEVVLITEDKEGKQTFEVTNSDKQFTFDKIVVLVNQNTASASEVLAAALQDHLDNVTIVGVNTYGKGTVQQTRMFDDNSAIKYTTAEWLTPSGEKIHGVGIKPDVEIALHDILTHGFAEFEEDKTYSYDTVGIPVQVVQSSLDFLGYDIKRFDGYFDEATEVAMKSFEKDLKMKESGVITLEVYEAIMSKVIREWTANKNTYDVQLHKAIEILGDK